MGQVECVGHHSLVTSVNWKLHLRCEGIRGTTSHHSLVTSVNWKRGISHPIGHDEEGHHSLVTSVNWKRARLLLLRLSRKVRHHSLVTSVNWKRVEAERSEEKPLESPLAGDIC